MDVSRQERIGKLCSLDIFMSEYSLTAFVFEKSAAKIEVGLVGIESDRVVEIGQRYSVFTLLPGDRKAVHSCRLAESPRRSHRQLDWRFAT